MNTITTNNNLYYAQNKSENLSQKNPTFKGYAVNDQGNIYKQSDTAKCLLPALSLAFSLIITGTMFFKLPSADTRKLLLTTTLMELPLKLLGALGLGTVIDMIVNKVRSNNVNKQSQMYQQYMTQSNGYDQYVPEYQQESI